MKIDKVREKQKHEELTNEFIRIVKYLIKLDPAHPYAYELYFHLNPKCQDTAWELSVCYFNQGEKDVAIKWAKKAASIKPSPDIFLELGGLCIKCEEYQEAIYAFDRALDLNREKPEAYCGRGVANRKLGYYVSACLDFDKAIRYRKQYPRAYYNRGIAKEEQGEIEEAIADFRKAMQMDPEQEKYKEAHRRAREEQETGKKRYDWEAGSSHDVVRLERRVDDLEIRMDKVEEELKELKKLAKQFAVLDEDERVDVLQRLTLQTRSEDQKTKIEAKQVAHFVLKEHESVISLSTRVKQAADILAKAVGFAIMTGI